MATQDDAEAARSKALISEVVGDVPDEPASRRQIRYTDDEISRVYQSSHRLKRTHSIQSVHSARTARSVDPAVALPIQYRTLSYNIEDSQRGKFNKRQEDRSDKAVGDFAEAEWHTLSEGEICKKFRTDASYGLSLEQIQAACARYGKNIHTPPPSRFLRRLFWYFFGGFGSILLIGGILVLICWKPLGNPPAKANLALAIVLFIVFFIQALFNAWQDFSSSRVMKSITGMMPEECHVLRGGQINVISSREIVPGDLVLFKAGTKLPADVRFTTVSSDAKFDRSILTGESAPLAAVTESTDSNYLETRNMGFAGTHCTSGSGSGLVVAIGDSTVFGHIAKLTSTPSAARSPLQKEIIRFIFIIVLLMVSMNLIVLAVWAGYIRKAHPQYMPVASLIVNMVSVAIAFVPEGLPIALTTSLTITANKMRKNNILCKSLKTVETLGTVSVLLSDKTGTLTRNQMSVTDILIGSTRYTLDSIKRDHDLGKPSKSAISQLRIVSAINNAGEFDPQTANRPIADRRVIADATDAAILRFSEMLAPVSEARNLWRKRFDLAFNSRNKFAIRVHSVNHPESVALTCSADEYGGYDYITDLLLTIKGAPDVLLSHCTAYVGEDGEVHELDASVRTAIELVKDEWSRDGKRVLLLARKILSKSSLIYDAADGDFETEALQHASSNLTFIGLLGILDPPRGEIPEVIQTLRQAGIRTMMVTGDFKLTAQAIARQCKIINTPDELVDDIDSLSESMGNSGSKKMNTQSNSREAIVLSGPELSTLNAAQWSVLTSYKSVVFARTTPAQKLHIVKEFKSQGHIVAMTGDGVNDAPSLKEADIGIAPGSASDIALEAADMVLLDSFSAIITAVLQGRTVFDNLRKLIAYLLPAGSFSEFWPVMTSVIFGLPQILSSFLMIIICCFTDCAAAITLAFEKAEADVLLRPPRDVKRDRLVDWRLLAQSFAFVGMIECICSFAMAFWWLQRQGVSFGALWFSYGDFSAIPHLTADEVASKLNTASSIYFVNLVVMQWFNLMALRTRRLSISQQPPLFGKATQNWYLFPAILFAVVIVFIFCYIPGVQDVIGSAPVPSEHWLLPLAFGLGLLCLDEMRKAGVRRWPGALLAKIAW